MIQIELELALIIFTLISTLWAIRSHFKSYQREDSIKVAELALITERITYLNKKYDVLNARLSEIEKQQSEMHVIRNQVSTMYNDLQSMKGKIDSIISILLEKNHSIN